MLAGFDFDFDVEEPLLNLKLNGGNRDWGILLRSKPTTCTNSAGVGIASSKATSSSSNTGVRPNPSEHRYQTPVNRNGQGDQHRHKLSALHTSHAKPIRFGSGDSNRPTRVAACSIYSREWRRQVKDANLLTSKLEPRNRVDKDGEAYDALSTPAEGSVMIDGEMVHDKLPPIPQTRRPASDPTWNQRNPQSHGHEGCRRRDVFVNSTIHRGREAKDKEVCKSQSPIKVYTLRRYERVQMPERHIQ